ncbi:MAG: hypothetical protein Q4G25_16730 [Paracoccus sp. (in: a-proteobacteria)]|nr:hypothetical protein [Paracoccus sp. (in: a-proteobacteria)]
MSMIFDDAPKMPGILGDYAKVAFFEKTDPPRVLIRAVDALGEDAASLAFSPDQARALAAAIVAAANQAEAGQ